MPEAFEKLRGAAEAIGENLSDDELVQVQFVGCNRGGRLGGVFRRSAEVVEVRGLGS